MTFDDARIKYAVEHTEILRLPKQKLATFGTTNINYYLLTEPAYSDLTKSTNETVIREGKVIAERPRIVTPFYLSRLEGFSQDAKRYFEMLTQNYGGDSPGLFYTYKNEPKQLNIVSDSLPAVVDKLNAEIDQRGDTLASIIKGEDTLWDVALLKFIYELTRGSLETNLRQMWGRGLLSTDASGVPAEARGRIEEMFKQVAKGELEPNELKDELDRWNLFEEYQDRFFGMFGRRR